LKKNFGPKPYLCHSASSSRIRVLMQALDLPEGPKRIMCQLHRLSSLSEPIQRQAHVEKSFPSPRRDFLPWKCYRPKKEFTLFTDNFFDISFDYVDMQKNTIKVSRVQFNFE
jgi:hypothetical protein